MRIAYLASQPQRARTSHWQDGLAPRSPRPRRKGVAHPHPAPCLPTLRRHLALLYAGVCNSCFEAPLLYPVGEMSAWRGP